MSSIYPGEPINLLLTSLGRVESEPAFLGLIDALIEAELAPRKYGLVDGAIRLRFSRDAVAKDAARILENQEFLAQGPSHLAIRLRMRWHPGMYVKLRDLPSDVAAATKARWLRAADRAFELMRPELLVVSWTPSRMRRRDWRSSQERSAALMSAAMFDTGRYYHNGPCGLGVRTYLCSHLAGLIGDAALDALPAVVTRLEGGAVRIDLSPDLTTASMEEFVDTWQRCMDLLAPRQIFCVPWVDDERFIIRYSDLRYDNRPPRFSRPPEASE